ncbi:aerotolerance regulator BatD [Leptospira perolatii]|uniref:Aerotolerance regulator BatD n=1 Tax=Leptospira perolatii TaxID=2023191 RepID=A0A2M9ZQ15_9LEPT|nr:aerotolerance regulator BatD [Leptospira perolatii]PJZ74061.1 aerotolerance regulator BatD [Leptospira perolatii]
MSASPLLAADPRFYLTQSYADLGDPVFAVCELEGKSQVRILEKEFIGQGIKAVYWGMEDNTSILNYKVLRRKLLKYRLVAANPGKYEVPEIVLESDGKEIHSGKLIVEFGARKAKANSNSPGSLWNRFFSTEEDMGPSDEDLKVVFQMDKKQIWVGQPVLGFFALYYRNVIRPYFDRDPSNSIEFPYFRSEILSGMSLSIPESVVYNGSPYEAAPYNKEFYVLTPLKAGEFSLGSTTFHLEGQLQSYFHMRTIRTVPSNVIVKDLPRPSPSGFQGAVGKFEAYADNPQNTGWEGEPFALRIVVKGKGNLSPVRDPLKEGCASEDCFPEATLVQVLPQREFRELDPGEYGFHIAYTYLYSVVPKKAGKWNPAKHSFHYFDPESGKYAIAEIFLPAMKIEPPRPKQSQDLDASSFVKTSKFYISVLIGLGILGIGAGFFWITIRMRAETKVSRNLNRLDEWIGSKRGLVLKHAILAKGGSEEDASLLSQSKSGTKSLYEAYRGFDSKNKSELLKSSYRILDKIREDLI